MASSPDVVLDASAFVDLVLEAAGPKPRVGPRLRQAGCWLVPGTFDAEVISAFRRRRLHGDDPPQLLEDLPRFLESAPLTRVATPAMNARIVELHPNMTAFDAGYVALAEALGLPLLTTDGRLARAAGPRCQIELLAG